MQDKIKDPNRFRLGTKWNSYNLFILDFMLIKNIRLVHIVICAQLYILQHCDGDVFNTENKSL